LVLGVALVLNLGFYLPRVSGVPGAGVPGADKIAHVVVFALTVWAAGRVLAPLSRFPMGWVVIAALVHTGLIEIIQGLLPGPGWAAGPVLAPLSRSPMGWVVIAALVHPVLIEIIQGLFLGPGRGAEAGDVLAGVIGIAIGTGLWIGERLRERRPVPETVAVS